MAEPAKAAAKPSKPLKKPDGSPIPTVAQSRKQDGFKVGGQLWFDKELGHAITLPPGDDFVADCYMTMPRWMIVQACQLRYGCSPRTVDSAIARVKVDYEKVLMERRAERVSRHLARLDAIYKQAMRAKDFGPAVRSISVQAQLAGDILKVPEAPPAQTADEMTEADLVAIIAKASKAAKPAPAKKAAKPKPKKKKAARGH